MWIDRNQSIIHEMNENHNLISNIPVVLYILHIVAGPGRAVSVPDVVQYYAGHHKEQSGRERSFFNHEFTKVLCLILSVTLMRAKSKQLVMM